MMRTLAIALAVSTLALGLGTTARAALIRAGDIVAVGYHEPGVQGLVRFGRDGVKQVVAPGVDADDIATDPGSGAVYLANEGRIERVDRDTGAISVLADITYHRPISKLKVGADGMIYTLHQHDDSTDDQRMFRVDPATGSPEQIFSKAATGLPPYWGLQDFEIQPDGRILMMTNVNAWFVHIDPDTGTWSNYSGFALEDQRIPDFVLDDDADVFLLRHMSGWCAEVACKGIWRGDLETRELELHSEDGLLSGSLVMAALDIDDSLLVSHTGYGGDPGRITRIDALTGDQSIFADVLGATTFAVVPIPEPGTGSLVGLGLALGGLARRRG